MKKRFKMYLKLNLLSLFFITLSFISVTLAWFAYTGSSRVNIDIPIRAWNIALEKDGQRVTHDLVITVEDVYPGMEMITELVKVINLGDTDADIDYEIVSARALDNIDHTAGKHGITSAYLEDLISHELPVNINVSLSKRYVLKNNGESFFEVSVSWPLDSDRDELDSKWGNDASVFNNLEKSKLNGNPSYQIRPALQVIISLSAEQALESNASSDPNFSLGDTILIDVTSKKICTSIGGNCIKTSVIDVNNTIGDSSVTLLPNLFNTYGVGVYDDYDAILSNATLSWNVTTREFKAEDLLPIIAGDVENSLLIRPNLSNAIVGSIKNSTRLNLELNKVKTYQGHYIFSNDHYPYLLSTDCYWLKNDYSSGKAFALQKVNTDISKIFGYAKDESCKIVPVIVANKNEL